MKFQTCLKSLCLASVLIMYGCSDDSGSSSGSSSTDEQTTINETDDFNQYAGTYVGIAVIEYSASALGISATREEDITVIIESDGEATLIYGDERTSAMLVGDGITSTRNVEVSTSNVSCEGVVSFSANINEDRIVGDGTGSGECQRGSDVTPVEISASLSLEKQ